MIIQIFTIHVNAKEIKGVYLDNYKTIFALVWEIVGKLYYTNIYRAVQILLHTEILSIIV